MKGLTKAQHRALSYLATVGGAGASPSMLGQAMSDREHIKAQGAGRVGGAMGARLVKMGLACRALYAEGWGYRGYAITPAGRAALSASKEPGR